MMIIVITIELEMDMIRPFLPVGTSLTVITQYYDFYIHLKILLMLLNISLTRHSNTNGYDST